MNYFEIFGLRPAFSIDTNALQKEFYNLSRTHHPDRFHASDADTLVRATEKFAEINKAYMTLGSEDDRTEYLFELAGFDPGAGRNQLPPGLTDDYFTLQEVLEDGGLNEDQRKSEIEKFSGLLKNEITAADAEKRAAMAEWKKAGAPLDGRAAPFFTKAAMNIRQKAYLNSMSHDLEKKCQT